MNLPILDEVHIGSHQDAGKKETKTKEDMNVSGYAGNAQQQLKDQYKLTMALSFRANQAITLRLLININKSVCKNEQLASA